MASIHINFGSANVQDLVSHGTSNIYDKTNTGFTVKHTSSAAWYCRTLKFNIRDLIPANAVPTQFTIKFTYYMSNANGGVRIVRYGDSYYSGYTHLSDNYTSPYTFTVTDDASLYCISGDDYGISIGYYYNSLLTRYCYFSNVDVEIAYSLPSYYLDLNGYLDGVESGNISGYGTADVYINSSRVAAGVTDFYTAYEVGSTYEIKNIVPTAGHSYNGVYSGSLTGTLNSNTSVYLNFTTVPTTVTVSFDSQGGSVFPSRELTIGGTYGTLPTPTKSFNEFLGWYTSTSYTTKIESSSIVPSNNHILYAKWQPIGINNIRLGGNVPSGIYIGSQQVKQVYIGSTLVYSIQ